jgi:phosphopantothenoylcysteine decarboxylase/phosphopantothenate--cysteine ligase
VNTAAEMAEAVLTASAAAAVLIMAAAVADFRPAQAAEQKIKKTTTPRLELEPTTDILTAVAAVREQSGRPLVMVGFAAESQNLIENAREKVLRKKLSLMVANDISAPDAGFGVDTNRVTLIGASGGVQPLPLLTKAQVADAVLERVVNLLAG